MTRGGDLFRGLIGPGGKGAQRPSVRACAPIPHAGNKHLNGRVRAELQDEVLGFFAWLQVSMFVEMARHVLEKAIDYHHCMMATVDLVPEAGEIISAGVVGAGEPLVVVGGLPRETAGVA